MWNIPLTIWYISILQKQAALRGVHYKILPDLLLKYVNLWDKLPYNLKVIRITRRNKVIIFRYALGQTHAFNAKFKNVRLAKFIKQITFFPYAYVLPFNFIRGMFYTFWQYKDMGSST